MTKAGIPGSRIQVRHDRSAKPSGLWEKAERKMAERDERGKKMFEPGCIGKGSPKLYSLPNGCCKASPASSFSPDLAAIFQLSDISRELSFGFPFLLREKKREILDTRAVLPSGPDGTAGCFLWV